MKSSEELVVDLTVKFKGGVNVVLGISVRHPMSFTVELDNFHFEGKAGTASHS